MSEHRALTCGMNLAWAEVVAAGADVPLRPVPVDREGTCCVEFQRADRRAR